MKCMANQDESVVVRVTEKKAEILKEEGFHFVPKSVWKEKTRDINKKEKPKRQKRNLKRVKNNGLWENSSYYSYFYCL